MPLRYDPGSPSHRGKSLRFHHGRGPSPASHQYPSERSSPRTSTPGHAPRGLCHAPAIRQEPAPLPAHPPPTLTTNGITHTRTYYRHFKTSHSAPLGHDESAANRHVIVRAAPSTASQRPRLAAVLHSQLEKRFCPCADVRAVLRMQYREHG